MKHVLARVAALLCVISCAAVVAVEVWPAARGIRTADQNGDGRPDVWRHYDSRGQLTEVDVDSNFDGSPDVEEFYERGILVRRESDQNFNGQTDLVEEFDAETHGQTRSVVDIDYDGTADMLVLFRDGRPVYSKRTVRSRTSQVSAPGPSRIPQDSVRRLARLIDPFESETAVRAIHVSGPDGYVGLSTSGGLPRSRIGTARLLSTSARLVARDEQLHALTLLQRRSPRAPPVA